MNIQLTERDREQIKHQNSHNWDGVTKASTLTYGWATSRVALAEASRQSKWQDVLTLLDQGCEVNDYQLCTPEWNTALHWAAENGAPAEIAERLVDSGAWRSLPNAIGKRPYDIATARGYQHLLGVLKPAFVQSVPDSDLQNIQHYFHEILRSWQDLITQHGLRLPELTVLRELVQPKMSFVISGMYGSYIYWLNLEAQEPILIVESNCRVVGGPVPRWECSPTGSKRVSSTRNQ